MGGGLFAQGPQVKKLNLNAIRTDGGTQPRERINMDVVGDYAEAIKVGIEFPPVIVFHDGAEYWLADGFHRFHAHKQAGKASIEAEVRAGTLLDAKLLAVGANGSHGLRRTNDDKRRAVQMVLDEPAWKDWSDRNIAEACGVSAPFVASIRRPPPLPKKEAPQAESAASPVDKRKPFTPKSAAQAKRAPWEKAPEPVAPESSDAFDGFDPIAELETTQKLLEAADKRIEALTTDDTKAELAKQIGIRQGIEARLSLEMEKVAQLQKELDAYGRWFAELRKASGLEKRSEITRLVRESANARSAAV
jgi:uncharacterized ParB-like nuclease family protein